MGKWPTTIWSAITSIIMKGCFTFWRTFSQCWLSLLSLQSNHFISGGRKKINSMANHKLRLIRVSKWTPTRSSTGCLMLQLCARGMCRKPWGFAERNAEKEKEGWAQKNDYRGGVHAIWSKEWGHSFGTSVLMSGIQHNLPMNRRIMLMLINKSSSCTVQYQPLIWIRPKGDQHFLLSLKSAWAEGVDRFSTLNREIVTFVRFVWVQHETRRNKWHLRMELNHRADAQSVFHSIAE